MMANFLSCITHPALFLLLFLPWSLQVVLAEEESCAYSLTRGHSLPHDTACACGKETCFPNELCYVFPEQEEPYENFDFSSPLNQCLKVLCDDVSGDWIWYGRNKDADGSSNDNFAVWGTVKVTQTNCQPVLTVSDQSGTVTTFYALLWWRETYAMSLFGSEEQRDEYESGGEYSAQSDASIVLLQDFGNGASEVQCVYFGSFVNDDVTFGTMGRDVDGAWSIGDELSVNEAPGNENCPEGYPEGYPSGIDGGVGGDTPPGKSSSATATYCQLPTVFALLLGSVVAVFASSFL
jgi:hypothetical protein